MNLYEAARDVLRDLWTIAMFAVERHNANSESVAGFIAEYRKADAAFNATDWQTMLGDTAGDLLPAVEELTEAVCTVEGLEARAPPVASYQTSEIVPEEQRKHILGDMQPEGLPRRGMIRRDSFWQVQLPVAAIEIVRKAERQLARLARKTTQRPAKKSKPKSKRKSTTTAERDLAWWDEFIELNCDRSYFALLKKMERSAMSKALNRGELLAAKRESSKPLKRSRSTR